MVPRPTTPTTGASFYCLETFLKAVAAVLTAADRQSGELSPDQSNFRLELLRIWPRLEAQAQTELSAEAFDSLDWDIDALRGLPVHCPQLENPADLYRSYHRQLVKIGVSDGDACELAAGLEANGGWMPPHLQPLAQRVARNIAPAPWQGGNDEL